MENNNANGQNATPNGAGKAPLVKRIKIPTVRPGAAPVQPAGQKVPNPATRAPAAAGQNDPATQLEAQHTATEEPQLPPEDKKGVTASAIEAEEIEKAPVRKKRRGLNLDSDAEQILEKKEENIQVKKAKVTAKKVLSSKWGRLGIIILLIGIICAGVYSSLPIIAEKKLPTLFAENGMPFKNFTLKQLTIDTMELTNVSDKTGTMRISSIKFNYSLVSLYTGNIIRSMELSNVTINGEKRNDGISLGALNDLIYSSVNTRKGNELIINSLQIKNGTFILKDNEPPKTIINEDGEEEEVDNTISVSFNANGSLSKTGLNLKISTDYASPSLVLKTETALNKTAMSTKIKTDITEGNLMKKEETLGSVTGSLEIAVDNGVLSTGSADLLVSSSSQKLKLTAGIVPKESSFDISLDLDRSFDDPKDAAGKFVGTLSAKANDVTINGTFQSFQGTLPLQLKAPLLTNGQTAVRDLDSEAHLKFACTGANCSASLVKPMKFAFSSLQTTAMLKQVKIFQPLELTVNPDPNDPFLKSESSTLSFTLPISAFSTQVFLADNRANTQIATALNGFKARVNYNLFSGAYSGEATFQQSGYADKDIRMTGIQGIISFNSNALPDARLRVAKATLTKQNILPDFSTELRFRPVNRAQFGIDSIIQIQNGIVTATLNGSYSLPTHEWDLYLVVPKFILSNAGLKLSTVLPFMLDYLPDSTIGAIAAKGRIAFKDGIMSGPLNVLLENIETTWHNIKADALNGVITFTSLLPLETPANQQLFIGTLNTGIPFQNALFNFQIQANKGVEISNARMKYADAQFKTIKSFFFPYEGQPSPLLFEGNGLNLSMLTENLKSSALQVDGTLNSEWRLSFTDDKKLKIDQAVFTSKQSGTLHFTAPEALRSKMDPQMLAYLKDVIVKNMTITAKGQMDGPVTFDVSINGHSPLETADQDQEVSFDFKSSFKNLLKQESGLFEIPADVLLSLQNYAK
ncbi:MAG: YdbH domain-containing protein [Alphaproteobacteria bacterium]|nr:YdbH domain-containing protein [Alphaproteobacteria bacterium]